MNKTIFHILMFLALSVVGFSLSTYGNGESEVVVINPIEVPKGKEKLAIEIWDNFASYFRKQPGYLGTKLHRTIDPKAKFHLVNVARWKSAKHFFNALNSDEIQKLGEGFPKDMPHYPSIYEIVRK